jgi:TfoX/Sxy family transcriptional regulator of competence genes
MKFTKPSPGLVEEFKAAAATLPDGQPRKMFGYDCVFVGGNFAAGLWQNTAVFKLSDQEGARFTKEHGAIPFAPMQGRVMRGWYEAPEELAHDAERLTEWCHTAAAFARTLPPKAKKGEKAKKVAKAASAPKASARSKPKAKGAKAKGAKAKGAKAKGAKKSSR